MSDRKLSRHLLASFRERRVVVSAISRLSLWLLLATVLAVHTVLFEAPLAQLAILFVCFALAAALRQILVVHATLLFFLIALAGLIPSGSALHTLFSGVPILALIVPLALSFAIMSVRPHWRSAISPLSRGHADAFSLGLAAAVALGSAGALLIWANWTDNLGLGKAMMENALTAPFWLVVLVGLPVFAVLNAVTEEVIYRGVLQPALVKVGLPFALANVFQAAAFAALHYEMGFPNGAIGYGMVFVYGLFLGYLRLRTSGLALPIATHAVADLVIGATLLWIVVS